ncbi:MAG: hypothetical protein IIC80_12035 [Chloroflexi bacterium]|nr:hypothetical protein [Chloroflexota bacterium]
MTSHQPEQSGSSREGIAREIYRIARELRSSKSASSGGSVLVQDLLDALPAGASPMLRDRVEALVRRDEAGPDVGVQAPDFALKRMGSDQRVRLSDFRDTRPVALLFGSYT